MKASRSTFREKAGAVCWQKQLRDRYLIEGVPPVPHLDVKRAIVRPVSRKLAEQVILKYEWLGTLPSSCTHYFGLFFGGYCAGVTCVGVGAIGANLNAYKEFRLCGSKELAYLTRGACVHWAPKDCNSKLVSWTCKFLSKGTSAKIAIAYSDSDAGEIGTIYQACGWVYVGRGAETRQWLSPSGALRDQKFPWNLADKRGGSRADWTFRLKSAGWTEQRSNPKHRNVQILDRFDAALIARIERMRQPYPKRAGSIAGDAPANHAG